MDIIKDIDFIIKFFILGAVPWIFLSRENSLFFKIKNLKLSVIFNCFASLLATSIYLSLYYSTYSGWKDDMVFFYWAIPLAVLYFIMLFLNFEWIEEEGNKDTPFEIQKLEAIKQRTDEQNTLMEQLKCRRSEMKGIVIVHFFVYIIFFSLLAFGLGVNSAIHLRSMSPH